MAAGARLAGEPKPPEPGVIISITEPAATSLPLCITTTCVQICSTSASRWLDTTTVRPVSA